MNEWIIYQTICISSCVCMSVQMYVKKICMIYNFWYPLFGQNVWIVRFDIAIVIVKLHYRDQVMNRLVGTDNVIYFMRTYFLTGLNCPQLEPKHWNTFIMSTPLLTLIYAAADARELKNEQWFHSNTDWDLLSKHTKCWFSKRLPKRKWETMINHTCQAPEEIPSNRHTFCIFWNICGIYTEAENPIL